MASKAIPGYLGALQFAAPAQSSPTFQDPLPIWAWEYGGNCQLRAIYLASGIPYPDVFPEREDITLWHFAGPARVDFNPFIGGAAQGIIVGRAGQIKLTIYDGGSGLGNQIGFTQFAVVAALRWSGTARGQAMWILSIACAWDFNGLLDTLNTTSGTLFRAQGDDTTYTGGHYH